MWRNKNSSNINRVVIELQLWALSESTDDQWKTIFTTLDITKERLLEMASLFWFVCDWIRL